MLFNASVSKGKGRADGEGTFYTNTQVKAGEQVIIISGGDTTLQSAVVKANQVKADVGGNLNISSLQDTNTYTSEQKSSGGSLSVGTGSMSGSTAAASALAHKSNPPSERRKAPPLPPAPWAASPATSPCKPVRLTSRSAAT